MGSASRIAMPCRSAAVGRPVYPPSMKTFGFGVMRRQAGGILVRATAQRKQRTDGRVSADRNAALRVFAPRRRMRDSKSTASRLNWRPTGHSRCISTFPKAHRASGDARPKTEAKIPSRFHFTVSSGMRFGVARIATSQHHRTRTESRACRGE
jgi:hypothetical protein